MNKSLMCASAFAASLAGYEPSAVAETMGEPTPRPITVGPADLMEACPPELGISISRTARDIENLAAKTEKDLRDALRVTSSEADACFLERGRDAKKQEDDRYNRIMEKIGKEAMTRFALKLGRLGDVDVSDLGSIDNAIMPMLDMERELDDMHAAARSLRDSLMLKLANGSSCSTEIARRKVSGVLAKLAQGPTFLVCSRRVVDNVVLHNTLINTSSEPHAGDIESDGDAISAFQQEMIARAREVVISPLRDARRNFFERLQALRDRFQEVRSYVNGEIRSYGTKLDQ